MKHIIFLLASLWCCQLLGATESRTVVVGPCDEVIDFEDLYGPYADHLRPVDVEARIVWPLEHSARVMKYLHLTGDGFGRITLYPSFKPERSLAIYSEKPTVPDEAPRYYMTTTTSSASFTFAEEEEIQVERVDIEISKELACSINSVIMPLAHGARYPSKSQQRYTMLDGATYQFTSYAVVGRVSGKVHSPPSGTRMAELVRLADLLFLFVDTQELSESVLIQELDGFSQKLNGTTDE